MYRDRFLKYDAGKKFKFAYVVFWLSDKIFVWTGAAKTKRVFVYLVCFKLFLIFKSAVLFIWCKSISECWKRWTYSSNCKKRDWNRMVRAGDIEKKHPVTDNVFTFFLTVGILEIRISGFCGFQNPDFQTNPKIVRPMYNTT